MKKEEASKRLFNKTQALIKEESLEQSDKIQQYKDALNAAYTTCDTLLWETTWATMRQPALTMKLNAITQVLTLQGKQDCSTEETRELHHLLRLSKLYEDFHDFIRTTAREAELEADERKKRKEERRQQEKPAAIGIVAKHYKTKRRGYVSRRGRY